MASGGCRDLGQDEELSLDTGLVEHLLPDELPLADMENTPTDPVPFDIAHVDEDLIPEELPLTEMDVLPLPVAISPPPLEDGQPVPDELPLHNSDNPQTPSDIAIGHTIRLWAADQHLLYVGGGGAGQRVEASDWSQVRCEHTPHPPVVV